MTGARGHKLSMLNFVKEYRKMFGIRQQDLADFVNVSRQTIIYLEKGVQVPSLKIALKIAKFFEVPIERLFSL